ncbi:hypothetical protein HAX54_033792, partial [Datura stramonium]|nr:hypothetical protein [Datura stramonium]
MVEHMEGYITEVKAILLRLESPLEGWFKCNSDGNSKGNPGPSSMAFCIRNRKGDLIYA